MLTCRFCRFVMILALVAMLVACGATPTVTPLPPAATAVPPTATPLPPTATAVPPTATPVPPTATPPPLPTATASVPPKVGGAGGPTVSITWYGHSTFVLSASTGLKALLDPTGASTGYKIPTLEGIDLVTTGHEHSDHNAVSLAAGSPLVLKGLAGNDWAKIDQMVKGVRVRTVGTYHDDTQGSQRGKNAIFIFDMDGLRVAHLSDLGHLLSAEQVKDIGPVDVVMIPVGGYYTIDAKKAAEVVNQLNAMVIIPMHYRTAAVSQSLAGVLAPVDDFITAMGDKAAVSQPGQTVTLERGKLPATRTIMVLKYATP